MFARPARVREREKERCAKQPWREEKVEEKEEEEEEEEKEKEEEEEKEEEKVVEEKGMGDHHRNDRSDGLGRPSTTRDLPDVAGMNESAHIPLCTIRRKGSDM